MIANWEGLPLATGAIAKPPGATKQSDISEWHKLKNCAALELASNA